jgi:hypothetical protein
MATETFTRLIDDLDGTKAERTVDFAWDGVGYSIDLSKKNVAALQKALQPFVAAARVTPAQPSGKGRGRTTPGGSARAGARKRGDAAAVRDWARANGYTVSDRGRIGADIVAAYEASK